MLTILHGDDTNSSRARLNILVKGLAVIRLEGQISYDEFINQTLTDDLFINKKTLLLENIFSQKTSDSKKIEECLISFQANSSLHLYIWEGRKIDLRILKKYTKANLQIFELPKYYFAFLDSLAPRSAAKIKQYLDSLINTMDSEAVFYSVIKRIRQLMVIKEGKQSLFDETAKMREWQIVKLYKQSSLWNTSELKNFYGRLFLIERRMKTSNLALILAKELDILLYGDLN